MPLDNWLGRVAEHLQMDASSAVLHHEKDTTMCLDFLGLGSVEQSSADIEMAETGTDTLGQTMENAGRDMSSTAPGRQIQKSAVGEIVRANRTSQNEGVLPES